jgi:hypothetical protein
LHKYATFIAGDMSASTGLEFAVGGVALPSTISFHALQ